MLLALSAPGQSFLQPKVVETGNWPVAVYSADVNGDGIPDLIAIDQGATPSASTTRVFLGDGKVGFTQSAVLATAGNSLALGPIAGSGVFAITWAVPLANGVGFVSAREAGNGIFGAPVPVGALTQPAGANPMRMGYLTTGRIAPVPNGAEQYSPFLIAEDVANNAVYAIVYNPDGTYTSEAGTLPDGPGPEFLSPSGVVSNGVEADILHVIGLTGSTLQVFGQGLNPNLAGSTPAVPTQRFAGISGVRSALVQDVSGDGIPDLLAEGAEGHLDVFLGQSSGAFQSTPYGGSITDGRTGDGGHLIAAKPASSFAANILASTPSGISTLLSLPGGTQYRSSCCSNAGPGHTSYAVADFNGDGYADLAVDSPEGIAILYGAKNSNYEFVGSSSTTVSQPALSGALGKFTGSGFLDAVVAISPTQAVVLPGYGTGQFAGIASPLTATASPAGQWGSIQTGDFNGDGLLDVAITADGPNSALPAASLSAPSGVVIQYGNGQGTLAAPVHVPFNTLDTCPSAPAALYGSSAAADFNGDGIADLVNRGVGSERVYEGSASGLVQAYFNPNLDGSCDLHAHDLVFAGDLNNDGKPDAVVQRDGHLFVELNGTGGTPFSPNIGAAQDLSVDGALTTAGQLTAPALATTFGGTVPTSAGGLGFPAFIGSMAIADTDRDGKNDLAVIYANLSANLAAPNPASTPNYLYLWYGSGGGKFLTSVKHPVNPVRVALSRNYYQVVFGDLNGDDIPDLILSDGYLIDVQYGLGDGTFGAEHHLLAGQGINSISVADVNGDGTLDLVVANGGAVLSNPVANLETLATNPDVNTGGITVLLNTAVTLPTPAGTLSASPNPAAFEAAYSLTATLATANGLAAPTGTVTFSVDGTVVGTATLSGGIANFTVAAHGLGPGALLPGSHSLTASYGGDANYAATTNLSGSFTVSLAPTTVVLTPTTPLQTFYGGPANGTFAIGSVDGSYPITGTYTVYDNGAAVALCTNLPVTLNGTPVECPYGDPILLPAGPHAFQVGYNGDPVNDPSLSTAVTYQIAPDPTTAMLVAAPAQATVGTPVTLTATIAGNLAVPNGAVNFLDGSAVIGSVMLSATGVASLTTSSLAVGTHAITAVYAGNQNFNAVTSAPVTVVITAVVQPIATDIALVSSLNPSLAGQQVTLTASILLVVPGTQNLVPPGTITFLDGTTVLATMPVTALANAAGGATLSLSTLAAGSHALTASYSGTPGVPATSGIALLASVSPVLTQVVNTPQFAGPASFTMSVSPAPVTVGIGRAAVLLVTITPVNGFAQPVALTCANLPYSLSCNFVSATIAAGGGGTTLYAVTTAPHDCSNSTPYFVAENQPGGGYGIAFASSFLPGLLLLALRRRRRIRPLVRDLLLLALACAGISAISGCGHCTDLGTKPGTYTFTVTGTAQGGPVSETVSQKIQLTATD